MLFPELPLSLISVGLYSSGKKGPGRSETMDGRAREGLAVYLFIFWWGSLLVARKLSAFVAAAVVVVVVMVVMVVLDDSI